MKIRTNELIDVALDWAVAKCKGILDPVHGESQPRVVFYSDQWNRYMRLNPPPQVYYSDRYEPSTDWAQGGPIIDQERLEFDFREDEQDYACFGGYRTATGPTHLIAAMRCYVASKLGDEVDVPDELIKKNQP